MKNIQLVAAVAGLLLSIGSTPAGAQGLVPNPNWITRFNIDFQRVFDFRRAEIEHQIGNLRADISERLSAGVITPARASALTARLDAIVRMEKQFAASDGVSAAELAQLEARLNNVRVAATTATHYY